MEREDGFYWVKCDGKWIVAFWIFERWRFTDGSRCEDSYLDEIDENKLTHG